MNKLVIPSLVAAALLSCTFTSSGQIGVANSVNGITGMSTGADASGLLFTSSFFDMSGGNAVAFLVTTEGAGDSALRGATFASQTMESVNVEDNGAGAQTATIFYLVDPVTTLGTFSFLLDSNYTASISYAYSQISLNNVDGYADEDTARSTSNANTTPLEVSYTVGGGGGFVLGAAANNDYNNARPLSIDTGNPDTDLLSHTLVGSSGHFHTYGDVPTSGLQTDGYLGQYQRTAIATVAFNAVPEPTTFALCGLGALALAVRRSRRA